MLPVRVDLQENGYDIVVGENILKDLGGTLKSLKIGSDAIIITNPVIKKLHGAALSSGLKKKGFTVKYFEVPEGEKSKSAKVALKLIDDIAAYSVKKNVFIIAFGGGVIGDLAGFVAAIYKRGIPFVQVPTTFLAQIDSAIGGKVAVDLPAGKNLIGAFYQPKIVWTDIRILSTLTKRQVRNGLAEAVKYGVIFDKNLFDRIDREYEKLLDLDARLIKEVVYECSRIKAKIVSNDEKETQGIRTILNFGHTVGHAVEAASRYRYHHGESVSLGMCVAADISRQMSFLEQEEVLRIRRVLFNIGLPVAIKKIPATDIVQYMKFDKKFRSGKNRFVLATSIGRVKVVEEIPAPVIRSAVRAFSER